MNSLLKVMPFFILLITTGCTKVGLVAANFPAYMNNNKIEKDIIFDEKPQQKLDIYLPTQVTSTPHPVIIFFYGGRWTTGQKQDYRFVGTALAAKGFIVIIPDYRKYPDVKFPTFVDDGAAAVSWTLDHILNYGGDPNRVHIMGHSSGAHIGALIASDPHYLSAHHKNRSQIKSFVGLSGPYAFTPDADDLRDMFGPPSNYPNMQVSTFIDGQQPPMLLIHGQDDTLVGTININRVKQAVDKNGGCLETKLYPGTDHIWTIANFTWFARHKSTIFNDTVDYIQRSEMPEFCQKTSMNKRIS